MSIGIKSNNLNRLILPVTFTLFGVGIVAAAVYLLAKELKQMSEEGEHEVENYDIVHNRPIFMHWIKGRQVKHAVNY